MKVTIFVRIIGAIDSRKLYDEIGHYGINVTDCGDYTLVYGDVYLETASRVFYHCSLYGQTITELTHDK
jgi:hypothetical protein